MSLSLSCPSFFYYLPYRFLFHFSSRPQTDIFLSFFLRAVHKTYARTVLNAFNAHRPARGSCELGRGARNRWYARGRMCTSMPRGFETLLCTTYRQEKGEAIDHAPEIGVLVGGHSLALRGVTRHEAGPYVCLASNVEGEGASPPLKLQVNCESSGVVWRTRSSQVYATALGQPVKRVLQLKRRPQVIKYSWVFNNSISSQRLPGEQVMSVTEGASVVEFVAGSHQEYGTLQCWAQNTVGKMTEPCLYHVVPASQPEAPTSCSVVNKTYDSLVVTCAAASDGGLRQSFSARVYEAVTGRGQVNISSPLPHFTLEGLTPGLDYAIRVSARNALGHSADVRLEAFTYKLAANTMSECDEDVGWIG
ncbi:hypothetical protein GWK47_027673 [Chionoecetes opilio]|uniref:Fibronectin type-III domain-containing protein n=1 Tax=Chionoecetes opilio TaxID=41210 RepID=A0A8J8WBT2_CHIOP|nr:hypothetical protein GWK47_027673 [Chionoecetes opilio]